MKKKRPTIRDVAKLAGVAAITVSRVINNSGYTSDETRDRVERAIAELNYIPNSLSQSLRFQTTNTVALIVSDITNPFWTTITRGVEDVCNDHDLHVILCNTDEKEAKLSKYVNMLLQRQTDGFILVPTSAASINNVTTILQKHVPLVILDRQLPQVDVDIVRGDSVEGAYQLTRYLIELGHQRIAMFSGPIEISTSEQRIEGYKRALQEADIAIDDELITFSGYTEAGGRKMALHMLGNVQPTPTALFAANNFIAVGILRALYQLELRVPQDISVVSFDDLPFDTLPEPFLTVVAQAPYELGMKAAELLIGRISGERTHTEEITLPVEVIVRKSCAPPKSQI
ncbi:MAG: LacI family DNA-binding transcriptional regulator [Anaerolineae bacterium]|nr:LacI family DNA-binding transcriptional regulator [Anaerolineae bacterium]